MNNWIVVVGNGITALSTVRCIYPIKKEGYEIILVSTTKKYNVAWHSKIPDKKLISQNLINDLLQLPRAKQGKGILLLTTDHSAVLVNLHRDKLLIHYRFLLPDPSTFEILMEKARFKEFAAKNKLSVPKTIHIRNSQELIEAGKELSFPCIVKPYLLHAQIINDSQQMEQYAGTLSESNFHSCVVQEYITGQDDQLYFCFLLYNEEGRLLQKFTARKLRQWPIAHGTTSLAMSMENKELSKKVEEFIACFQPRGYLSIEFKYDQIRNKFFIMEPTVGRFNQQIALTTAAGVNIPIKMIKMLSGKEVTKELQKNGIYWIYESNDFFAWRKSKTKYGYLANYLRSHCQVLFSFLDPLPLFVEVIFLARKRLRKILHA